MYVCISVTGYYQICFAIHQVIFNQDDKDKLIVERVACVRTICLLTPNYVYNDMFML